MIDVRPLLLPDDAGAALALFDAACGGAGAQRPDSWEAEDDRPTRRWLAADGPNAAGYAALWRVRDRRFRIDAIVHPARRRLGVGTRLLATLVDAAPTLGAMTLQARADARDAEALGFLERRGFRETMRMHRLELAVADADIAPLAAAEARIAARGLRLTTLAGELSAAARAGRGEDDVWERLRTLYGDVQEGWPDPDPAPDDDAPGARQPPAAERLRQILLPAGASPDGLFLAVEGERYVGFAGLGAPTGVHPARRNAGVATALKLRVMAHARAHGVPALHTNTGSGAMLRVNEKLGWRRVGTEVRLVRVLAAAGLTMLAAAGCAGAGGRAGARAPAAGDVVFFDDFDGPALDQSKWGVEVWRTTVNDEQQAYVDEPGTIALVRGIEAEGAANGALVIRAQHRPGVPMEGFTLDFVSGRLDTRGKMEFAYGTAAARIKLTAGAGLWPAFWALGTGDWPATGEIDIMENVGEPDWASVALHGPGYSGDTPLFNRLYFPPAHDATAWHVYSVEWRPDGLTFRVDDAVAYRATRPMVEHYGRWSYDNPKFLILNLALGGAYPLKTNGVRTPYPGLPAETVQLIKDGRARMLVDWVRVTRGG